MVVVAEPAPAAQLDSVGLRAPRASYESFLVDSAVIGLSAKRSKRLRDA